MNAKQFTAIAAILVLATPSVAMPVDWNERSAREFLYEKSRELSDAFNEESRGREGWWQFNIVPAGVGGAEPDLKQAQIAGWVDKRQNVIDENRRNRERNVESWSKRGAVAGGITGGTLAYSLAREPKIAQPTSPSVPRTPAGSALVPFEREARKIEQITAAMQDQEYLTHLRTKNPEALRSLGTEYNQLLAKRAKAISDALYAELKASILDQGGTLRGTLEGVVTRKGVRNGELAFIELRWGEQRIRYSAQARDPRRTIEAFWRDLREVTLPPHPHQRSAAPFGEIRARFDGAFRLADRLNATQIAARMNSNTPVIPNVASITDDVAERMARELRIVSAQDFKAQLYDRIETIQSAGGSARSGARAAAAAPRHRSAAGVSTDSTAAAPSRRRLGRGLKTLGGVILGSVVSLFVSERLADKLIPLPQEPDLIPLIHRSSEKGLIPPTADGREIDPVYVRNLVSDLARDLEDWKGRGRELNCGETPDKPCSMDIPVAPVVLANWLKLAR